jgi:nuclear pore complex protein Nup155
VISYLQRKSSQDVFHADLLWRYYSQAGRPHEAAKVQLDLAKSAFELSLDRRIEYLIRAKANASAYTPGIARSNRQRTLREITDFLDVANIQDDILQKLMADSRISERQREEVRRELDGQIQDVTRVRSLTKTPLSRATLLTVYLAL